MHPSTDAWLALQGADKALEGGYQLGSNKGGDSDADGAAVPVSAVANGSLTPGTTDKDSSGAPCSQRTKIAPASEEPTQGSLSCRFMSHACKSPEGCCGAWTKPQAINAARVGSIQGMHVMPGTWQTHKYCRPQDKLLLPFGAADAIGECGCAGDDGDDEAGAFDVSTIKGKLAKRAAAGGKRGKKAAVEEKKKKDEPKKPKQKVHPAPQLMGPLFLSCSKGICMRHASSLPSSEAVSFYARNQSGCTHAGHASRLY